METIAALQEQLRILTARVAKLEETLAPGFFALEPEAPPSRSRFTPPTENDSWLEAQRLGMGKVEHEKWRAFYGSNGWKVGRNSMKDWRAALRNWHLNSRPVDKTIYPPKPTEPSGAQIMAWNQEMDAVKKRIQAITPEGMQDLDEKDRAEMVRLRARVKELKAKLGREF